MRSTVIGNALCRIWRHLGALVHGINHLGDWGMPFAKMMTAYMRWGNEAELHKSPMRYMFDLYKRYGVEVKQNPALDDEAAPSAAPSAPAPSGTSLPLSSSAALPPTA